MSPFYTCVIKITIIWCMFPEIWSVTDMSFVILDHFLYFYLTNNPESQNLKIWKNACRYYHFKNVYHKWQSYDVQFLRYQVWQTECYFGQFFAPLPLNNPENQNFEKMKKKCWKYYFTHVYQKWQSYDIWFLRYREQPMEIFPILPH